MSIIKNVVTSVTSDAMSGVIFSGDGFSPSDIGGLSAWYDPSDPSTVTESGGLVSVLADKSDNEYDGTESTDSRKPTYVSSAINGLNAIRFSSDDRLSLPDALKTILNGNANTIIAVCIEEASGKNPLINANSGGTDVVGLHISSGNARYLSGGVVVLTSGGSFSGDVKIVAGRSDGSSLVEAFTNGGEFTSTGSYSGAASSDRPLMLGDQEFNSADFDGLLGELIVYDNKISDSDFNLLGNYLANKWGGSFTNL